MLLNEPGHTIVQRQLLISELFVKGNDRFNANEKIADAIMFVGGMKCIRVQPKAHQHSIESEFFLEQGHDRDAAAVACRDW